MVNKNNTLTSPKPFWSGLIILISVPLIFVLQDPRILPIEVLAVITPVASLIAYEFKTGMARTPQCHNAFEHH